VKKRNLWLIVALCFVSAALGYGFSRTLYRIGNIPETINDEAMPVTEADIKITPSTKMTYEYYYPEDNVTEKYEDQPPYFLIDYTLKDMQRVYPNWEIIYFSDREVVMRKTISGPSNQRYIIKENEGYIAVFYDRENEGLVLKEVTRKPVESLNEEEKASVKEGIRVVGKERLDRALEDYTS